MDRQRFGRQVRALRQRLGWRQADLAARARVSQTTISRIERGAIGGVTIDAVAGVVGSLGAELDVRLRWHGEDLDRLLDAAHATIIEWLVEMLGGLGWECAPEATFWIRGERGSVDVLAWQPATRRLLVIETKSVVPDIQAMLSALDRKVRLAPEIAARRGWKVTGVARAIVLADTSTNRRRARRFEKTLRAVLPDDGPTLRAWLAEPADPSPAALWFVSDSRVMTVIRRRCIRPKRKRGSSGPPGPR